MIKLIIYRHIGFYKKVSMLFIESEERKDFGDNNIFIIDKNRMFNCKIVFRNYDTTKYIGSVMTI